jgi:3',5'-nucleoside bisphosphate phosphatase
MNKKRIRLFVVVIFLLTFSSTAFSQIAFRNTIHIPDVLGYKTLKCDFHIHTVFSDGDVWPAFRIEEAWHDGLDAIALTDHLEYQPHKNEIPSDHNKPYQIAIGKANELGVTLIQGTEITRGMPPGHLNLLFVKDGNALVKDDWKETIVEAKNQNAILFWNHPSWVSQQPDGIARWYPEHDYILNSGIMFGLEIVNGDVYSPETHNWCIEKKLAVLGNSDTHAPIQFEWEADQYKHRPITLVFAKDNSPEAIREALLDRRTCVYSRNELIGDEKYLREIFDKSVSISSNKISSVGRTRSNIQITNNSDIPFELKLVKKHEQIQFPEKLILLPGKTVLFSARAAKNDCKLSEMIKAEYEINNLITAPGKKLIVPFEFDVNITPKQ